eukprot:4548148-Amphidinium_carterae.1
MRLEAQSKDMQAAVEEQLQKNKDAAVGKQLAQQLQDMQAAIEMRLEAAVEELLKRHVQAINAPAEKQGREQTMIRMLRAMPPEALSRALSAGAVTVARAIDDFSFDERVVLKC